MVRRNWTREELIVAFNLYCKTPFGRIHNRNPEFIALAKAIGRTPSALLLAAIDPATRYTSMQPPSAKLCSHPVQRYAATDWAGQNIIRAEARSGKPKFLSFSKRRISCATVRWCCSRSLSKEH